VDVAQSYRQAAILGARLQQSSVSLPSHRRSQRDSTASPRGGKAIAQGGETDKSKPGSALPRIAAARASDVRRTERRLDGVYREFVRRQRPAPLAAKQTSWCRRPFQTGCGRSGRVAQWRLMPKPGLRRPCGRATGVFPKRTVGCVGVSGDGRMTASTSSELNKPTLRGHSLSLFRGEAAGRILQRPRHCLPTARSPLMAGTVNAERRGNQMFVCSGGTRSGSDWAASSPVSITGGCMPSR
jgi:hypothetical protein